MEKRATQYHSTHWKQRSAEKYARACVGSDNMKAVAGGASFEGITRKENSYEIRWNRRSQTLLCLARA
jgi:hypothetical protein